MDGAVGLLFFLTLFAAIAPVAVASAPMRGMLIFFAIALTIAAVVLMNVAKGFGDTPLVVGAWLGGLLCALAVYLDYSIQRAARHLAWRLLTLDETGLRKPRDDD